MEGDLEKDEGRGKKEEGRGKMLAQIHERSCTADEGSSYRHDLFVSLLGATHFVVACP